MIASTEKNILVISDLHLGEDLRPAGAQMSYLRRVAQLERELESFLLHYCSHRIDEKPWRLVVNGDMVDFMSMLVLPESGETSSDEDERLYGLGFSERAAQKKLERVIVRHPAVFRQLAEFVQRGNELVIVIGNHDAEFHYESVQTTFRQWLCALAHGAGADEPVQQEYLARVRFCPWFFYEENLVYIEHGHQYDEYCSFDYQLHPVAAPKKGGVVEVALSLGNAGMRYFANQIPSYDPRTAETWSVLNYLRWGWGIGLGGAARCFYLYSLLIWRLVEAAYQIADRKVDATRRELHNDRLRTLSSEWRIAEEKLRSLDALRRAPITRRVIGILFALFVDRLMLGGLMLALMAVLFFTQTGTNRLLALLPPLVFGLLNQILNRHRLEKCAAKLRAMPRRIFELIRAPLVVFGHSHEPERVVANDVVYFNTGSWADEYGGKRFTHLRVLRRASGNEVELCAWENGSSMPFLHHPLPIK